MKKNGSFLTRFQIAL